MKPYYISLIRKNYNRSTVISFIKLNKYYIKKEHLQHIVNVFLKARDSSGLNINVGMRKVLVVKNDQMESCEKVRVSGKEMQEVDKFITWE